MNRAEFISRFGFDPNEKKLSYSRMKDLLTSVKEYVNSICNPRESTPDMNLGSLFECLLLEPENFSKHFFITPEVPNIPNQTEQKKSGIKEPIPSAELKSTYEKMIKDASNGKKIITKEMYAKAMKMVNSFQFHPTAKQLINQENIFQKHFEIEISGITLHGYLDILCKAKEDIILNGKVIFPKDTVYIIDIKKTNDVTLNGIEKKVRDYKYYIQSYLYNFAISAYIKAGLLKLPEHQKTVECIYIFQQDNNPYDTHCINFESVYDDLAKAEIIEAIEIFKAFLETPEKIFYGINAGISTVKPSRYQFDTVKERQKHEKFINNSDNLQKFMIESELDITQAKSSISISTENIFNHIEQLKKEKAEKEKTVDTTPESNDNTAADIRLAHTSPVITESVPVPNSSGTVENNDIEDKPKRVRRTKAEIEAARIMELQNISSQETQTDIFSAAQTAIIENDQETPENKEVEIIEEQTELAAVESIPPIETEKPENKDTSGQNDRNNPDLSISEIDLNDPKIKEIENIEFLISMAGKIKGYASGLYALKKFCLVHKFFPDMGAVDFTKLTIEQKVKLYEAMFNHLKMDEIYNGKTTV